MADDGGVGGSMDLTVVVVTSPFASMPSLSIICNVIESFNLIDGLDSCPVKIVMDGYKVCSESRPKKGKITAEAEILYMQYFDALKRRFQAPRFEIIRASSHLGFAHAVKLGLECCSTKFALVAQHDRYFRCTFSRLTELLVAMEEHEHIRYIGFPSASNITHDKLLSFNYGLDRLNRPDIKYLLGDNLYLQPLVFWFDSQHLCHVERYLQIFKPFRSMPKHLFDIVGLRAIKDMFLRPGDFIEDRFGQVQRNLLTTLLSRGHDEDTLVDLFKWYGSYLCWSSNNVHPFQVLFDSQRTTTLAMVSHLHGRQLDMHKIEQFAETFGHEKIKSTRFLRLIQTIEEEAQGKSLTQKPSPPF